MELLNLATIDTDLMLAITSICAVLISILSLIFTIVFSKSQKIHNKNSVRPLADFQLMDYDDNIAVHIVNNGSGPLIIKKFKATRENDESSAIINLMPTIGQTWGIYNFSIDGFSIAPGGRIILIAIKPSNKQVQVAVQNALKSITLKLEYTDIYDTSFFCEKKLSFFGGNREKFG